MNDDRMSWWEWMLYGPGLIVLALVIMLLGLFPDDDSDYSGTAAAAREDRP